MIQDAINELMNATTIAQVGKLKGMSIEEAYETIKNNPLLSLVDYLKQRKNIDCFVDDFVGHESEVTRFNETVDYVNSCSWKSLDELYTYAQDSINFIRGKSKH